jgi:flavin reductase (DIM6/NTAB) family NADH-FMN oxidoreductase RutF
VVEPNVAPGSHGYGLRAIGRQRARPLRTGVGTRNDRYNRSTENGNVGHEPTTHRIIDPSDTKDRELYFLLTSIVVPRPIAWVSTLAADGTMNLAPHSYTTVLSAEPPVVCFVSVGQKDSLRNARETGDFVYNLAGFDFLESINLSAANFPPDESEFDWTGLASCPSDLVRSPRVADAPVSMEARVVGVHQILDADNYLVMGEVVRIHLAERIMTDDRVDPAKLQPVGRLSGSMYSLQGDLVKLKRPTWQGLLDAGAEPPAGR